MSQQTSSSADRRPAQAHPDGGKDLVVEPAPTADSQSPSTPVAVRSLAADLFNDERRAQLGIGIDTVVLLVRELPTAREAALFLAADVDLAWRLFALGLLAEELAG